MLAAWARGTDRNLFPLCRSTAFKLIFEDSVKTATQLGLAGAQKRLYNRANFITKYQIVLSREIFFEFN